MNRNTTNTCIRVMGSNCARVSLCAYLKDTALAVVSFFAFLRFSYYYYYGKHVMPTKRDRHRAVSVY